MSEQSEEYADPLSAEHAPGLNLLATMRLYDVGMAILTSIDADAANRLNSLHASGRFMGEVPWVNLEDEA